MAKHEVDIKKCFEGDDCQMEAVSDNIECSKELKFALSMITGLLYSEKSFSIVWDE